MIYKNLTFCKYILDNLHRQVLQIHYLMLLLNWSMELSCLMCSGRRDRNCGDLELIVSKPKYRVSFSFCLKFLKISNAVSIISLFKDRCHYGKSKTFFNFEDFDKECLNVSMVVKNVIINLQ